MKSKRANVLILSVQVPFTRGGAEILCDGLRRELESRDFRVDTVSLPFSALPKERLAREVALWRALELKRFAGRDVDLVIATKFPSYMVQHPNKVLWLVHQHRQIYELYGTRFGDFTAEPDDESLRRMILDADNKALSECRNIFTISSNVSSRLKNYLSVESNVLEPPLPLGEQYYCGESQNYILSVGRICSMKRIDLLVKALPAIDDKLKLKIVGVADEPAIEEYIHSEIRKHHLAHRVEFLGKVDDETLISLFAHAHAVYYAPHDEDYGFVTLEALASSKPVVTASDSGGVLEFIRHQENGLIVEPNELAVAEAFNMLVNDSDLYKRLCSSNDVQNLPSNWDKVVEHLTETLK